MKLKEEEEKNKKHKQLKEEDKMVNTLSQITNETGGGGVGWVEKQNVNT